jgi:cell wall-associated NlpC family hydrolase
MNSGLKVFLTAVIAAAAIVSGAQAKSGKAIGMLGQATRKAKIYASPSSSSRVYSTASEFQYLVVNKSDSSQWLEVVLVNGAVGYVNSSAVAQLPFTVSGATDGSGGQTVSGTGSNTVDKMLNYSLGFIGTPYKWGGNSLTSGVDCSGFVKGLFTQVGVNLPRTASEQAKVGEAVTRLENLQPGDRLYFYEKRRDKIGHTGIYIGQAKFIHSSSGRKGVAIDDLREQKWRKILVGVRRSKFPAVTSLLSSS